MPKHCSMCQCGEDAHGRDYRQDPRWLIATAETEGPYPDLRPIAADFMALEGERRVTQIETIYALGMPDAEPPGFAFGSLASLALTFVSRSANANAGLAEFDPDHHGNLWRRLVYYQVLLLLGGYRDAEGYPDLRAVVKALAASRREWHRLAAMTHAARLGDLHAPKIEGQAGTHLVRLKRVVNANGGACTYCGEPQAEQVDHIIPRMRGGKDHLRNLTLACEACNHEKKVRTPLEWRARRLADGKCWPPLWNYVDSEAS